MTAINPVKDTYVAECNRPAKLAAAHWAYIKELLESHHVDPDEVERIGFHYKAAFVHGYKHAKQDNLSYGEL